MSEGHIFTPVHTKTGIRMEMRLSDEDIAKIGRGHEWSTIVTSLKTGRRYKVWSKPCDLPDCYCDVWAELVDGENEP